VKQRYTKCHRSLIEALREAREAAGVSQRALSASLKRPFNFAHLVESGERTLNVCEFIEYAHASGADPAVLIRKIAKHS
jgi:ribosome-binding protein aMBF1 (putative translation factor)